MLVTGVSGVLKVLHSYILFKTDYFRPFTDVASNKMKGKGFIQMKSFYNSQVLRCVLMETPCVEMKIPNTSYLSRT